MAVRHPLPREDVAAEGRLVLLTSRSACSPQLAACRVRVTVDGTPLDVPWGRTEIAVPAGRHRVWMQVGSHGGWGHVTDAVPVAPGASVEVFYRAPAVPHVGGALGPVPQRTRGIGVLVLGAVLLVLLLGGLATAVLTAVA